MKTKQATRKQKRGFALMSLRKRRMIAASGGRAFHSKPRGFAAMGVRKRHAIASKGGSTWHGEK
jgi:hypothetical protein